MRIVYVVQYFSTPAAAGGSRPFEFARRLAARGHEVDVVTTCRPDDAPGPQAGAWSTSVEEGVRVHRCTVDYTNAMSYPRRLRAFAEFAVRAGMQVRRTPCDVVFASSTPLTVCLPAVLGTAGRRIPVVFEVRDVWPEVPIALGALRHPLARRAAYGLEAWAYRHSQHVIALSPDMAASISRRFPDVPVTVIPNSSDIDLFDVDSRAGEEFRAARAWLGTRPLVVYAGTFGLVNGVGYLVRTAAAMRTLDPEVRFLLVGAGRELDEVRAEASALGVLDVNLFIEPPAPKASMPALMSAADIGTSTVIDVPELAANSANKVFDAFAASRPVLINHEGWLAEMLRATDAGIVAPPTDPVVAARLLADKLRDSGWTASARAAARALAHDRFNRDRLFERLHEVLRCAASGTRCESQAEQTAQHRRGERDVTRASEDEPSIRDGVAGDHWWEPGVHPAAIVRNVRRLGDKIATARRQVGVRGVLEKSATKAGDYLFDLRYGVETSRWATLARLGMSESEREHNNDYQPTGAAEFVRLMREAGLPRSGTFVDIGCGKGRVVLLAARAGFHKAVGVEVSADLCAAAESNAARFRKRCRDAGPIEIVCEDAADYVLDDQTSVVFMFNPFDEVVIKEVLSKIDESLRRRPRQLFLVYSNAQYSAAIDDSGLFRPVRQHRYPRAVFEVYAALTSSAENPADSMETAH